MWRHPCQVASVGRAAGTGAMSSFENAGMLKPTTKGFILPACSSECARWRSANPIDKNKSNKRKCRSWEMKSLPVSVALVISAGPASVALVISASICKVDGDASVMYGPATRSRWRTGILWWAEFRRSSGSRSSRWYRARGRAMQHPWQLSCEFNQNR